MNVDFTTRRDGIHHQGEKIGTNIVSEILRALTTASAGLNGTHATRAVRTALSGRKLAEPTTESGRSKVRGESAVAGIGQASSPVSFLSGLPAKERGDGAGSGSGRRFVEVSMTAGDAIEARGLEEEDGGGMRVGIGSTQRKANGVQMAIRAKLESVRSPWAGEAVDGDESTPVERRKPEFSPNRRWDCEGKVGAAR